VPQPKAQRNFTDPESRIMPDGANKGSFVQGYDEQIAVDAEAQVHRGRRAVSINLERRATFEGDRRFRARFLRRP
jgi:hypothetical protein